MMPFLSIRKVLLFPIPWNCNPDPHHASIEFMRRFFPYPGAYQMRQTRLTILLRIIEGQVTSTFLKWKNLGENQEKSMYVCNKSLYTRKRVWLVCTTLWLRLNNVQKEAKESDVQINYYLFLILSSSLFFKSFSNDVVTCIGWIDPMLWTSVIASTLKHCFRQFRVFSRCRIS